MVTESQELSAKRRRKFDIILLADTQAKRKVLGHRRALQATFDALLLAVQEGKSDRAELESLILDAQGDSEGIDDYLSQTIETKHYNEHRPDGSTIASHAFRKPELLENILRHCDWTDIMSFEQTCKDARAVVSRSRELQIKLCLHPAPEVSAVMAPFSYLDSQSWNRRGFFCYESHFRRALIARFLLKMDDHRLPYRLPQIGTRWKRMLILQPPIKTMGVTMPCCGPRTINAPRARSSLGKVTSETGLTLGDLYEWTENMFLEHECNMPTGHHEVEFKGRIKNLTQHRQQVTYHSAMDHLDPSHRDALAHQKNLEANVDSLITGLEQGYKDSYDLGYFKSRLLSAKADAQGLGAYFGGFLEPLYYNERRNESLTIATKVFDVPEILELVLGNLDVEEIFIASETCSTFRDTIAASSKLQTLLHLRAAPAAETSVKTISSSGLRTPQFDCALSIFDPNGTVVRIDASFVTSGKQPGGHLPTVGRRRGNMLVCQPPITRMSMQHGCWTWAAVDQPFRGVVAKSGLTIGDLWDAADELIIAHTLGCEFCAKVYEQTKYFNADEVRFVGFMRTDVDVKGWGTCSREATKKFEDRIGYTREHDARARRQW
ncbi:hypothetical protein LTR37_017879 [Vermiconidia calcicola]|uniref:Uncharacterized protein n=1 Tax=Vermiconidia calcicola TaxID=1690605 RepID=A0ACC3MIW9_9PEZI|nr:hypothetical protein LTR37_017879 [Vermiconidia calcicola]